MKTQNNAAIVAARKTIANLLGTGSRKEKVEFGKQIDAVVIESAVPLFEKGVDAKWLCADGKVPAVDSLAAVNVLLESNKDIDVTKLQANFTRQQVLEGLTEVEIASLKPVVETEVLVTETATVKAAETPKVEAPKTYPCSLTSARTKKRYLANELVVPNDVIVRSLLKLPADALLTQEQIISKAQLPKFVSDVQSRNYFWLFLSLEHNAKDRERFATKAVKEAQKEAGLEEYFAFCRTVKFGEAVDWKGSLRRKCNVCKHVHHAVSTRFPPLGLIRFETPRKDKEGKIVQDRDGNEVLQTPTAEAVMRRFSTCPDCVRRNQDVAAADWMTAELMTTVVNQDLEVEKAAMMAVQKEQERRNKRAQGNRGGSQQMSRADEKAGLDEFRQGKFNGDKAPRDGRSRNDQRRRDQEDVGSHDDLSTEMVHGG